MVLSPSLFNLYTNKLHEVYDIECDPVYIENEAVKQTIFQNSAPECSSMLIFPIKFFFLFHLVMDNQILELVNA